MPNVKFNTALIVGAGSGLSAALARVLTAEGIKVALAARTPADLDGLAKEIGAKTFACDASKRADVEKLFADLDGSFGAPEIVIYNPSYRTRGPIAELDPAEVEKALMVTAFGGFLVGQQAVKRMLPKKHGCIVFTGASASVKGYAQSAPFAMGKFALRGLAQSMARELHPQGHPCGACHHRRRHQERAAGRSRRARPRACSTRPRSPRPICTSSTSRTARGRPRWSCGLGSNRSEHRLRHDNSFGTPVRRRRFLAAFGMQPRGDDDEEIAFDDDGRGGAGGIPTMASADPDAAGNAAAGAAVGAGVGFAVGGPIGAAVGAGVGGTVRRWLDRRAIATRSSIERPGRRSVSEAAMTDSPATQHARKSRRCSFAILKKEAPLRQGFFIASLF